MDIDTFRRLITTFADPQEPLLIEKDRLVAQVNGDLLEVVLKQKSGEVYVTDDGDELPANVWILNKLARLSILADRLLATVPKVPNFVRPVATMLESLEVNPSDQAVPTDDALLSTLNEVDQSSPLETTILYITSGAGEGKTSLINEMTRQQANRFKKHESDWLLVPIVLGGRQFMRFDDITVGALQNRYRFPYLYFESFLELVRLGVIVPAFDGFEEMFVENSSGEAFSAMSHLIGSLQSKGVILVAARKAYFEFEDLRARAKFYEGIKEFHVGFGNITLSRWGKDQFLDYCEQRHFKEGAALYQKIADRLKTNSYLVTRAVLAKHLLDIATDLNDIDQLLLKLSSSGADFFSLFVREIIVREAGQKWVDRSGEVARPLLTVDEHCELLCLIALEMWQAKVDYLSREALEFIVDYFCETKRMSVLTASQARERIRAHALLIPSSNSANALEFDHEEFKQHFLGEAIANVCITQLNNGRSTLLNIFRKGPLPTQATSSFLDAIKKIEVSTQYKIISLLVDVAQLDGQASFTHENCAILILRILNGMSETECVIKRIAFTSYSLREIKLTNIIFDECFFAHTSLENSELRDLTFNECRFSKLDLFNPNVQRVILKECEIDSVSVLGSGLLLKPSVIRSELSKAGFTLLNQEQLEMEDATILVEPDATLDQFQRLFRAFGRTTTISDKLIHKKLGNGASAFIDDIIPTLVRGGILKELDHTGGGQKRIFSLDRPIDEISNAIEGCHGSFSKFVAELER